MYVSDCGRAKTKEIPLYLYKKKIEDVFAGGKGGHHFSGPTVTFSFENLAL